MKWLIFVFAMLLFVPLVSAINTTYTCIDSNTSQVNVSFTFYKNGTPTDYILSEPITCPFGCNSASGVCEGATIGSDMTSVWLVYAIGVTLLILGTVMGIPYGKMVGKEDIKSGFDTTVVVKYIFFFVGLFFVYLSLGMARRVGTVYGGESNISGAMDTTTMVMMITIILFLFIFVIEFLFSLLKWMSQTKFEKKWGDRTLGEQNEQ